MKSFDQLSGRQIDLQVVAEKAFDDAKIRKFENCANRQNYFHPNSFIH